MARHRHLKNAPLREALIDIQFEPRIELDAIDRFVSSIADEFSKKTDIWEAFFGLNTTGASPESFSNHSAVGRRLESRDAPLVLQCRVTGFTLSRLSPYGKWEELQTDAKKLWEKFVAYLGDVKVNRIAVRYINELKLSLPIGDFEEYLTCPPKVPTGLPQALSGFLYKAIIPDEAMDCVSVVTQAMEGPPVEGATGAAITILLDIDVYRQAGIGIAQADKIWDGLARLREQKNRMFFEHLTEKTVEMYE